MKAAVALTLIVLGSFLIVTPVYLRSRSDNVSSETGNAYLMCMFAGGGMAIAGIVFSFAALRFGGSGDRRE